MTRTVPVFESRPHSGRGKRPPRGGHARFDAIGALAAARLVLIICAAGFTLWVAAAELTFRQDTFAAVSQAARTGNTKYRVRLAELDEPNAAVYLRAATAANPRSGALWIDLGLALERESSSPQSASNSSALAEAEQALEHAARSDHQYLPAWTLANFAFRHGDAATFWRAARHAVALAYDRRRPLIELANRMEPQPLVALDRMQAAPPLERDYLDFLIGEERLDDAVHVAGRIGRRMDAAQDRRGEDGKRLAAFTGRLLEAQRFREALSIWKGLGWFPAAGAAALTNGDFREMPSEMGFDWRIPAVHGIAADWQPYVMQFGFSGAQPEAWPVIEQWIVPNGRRYRLSFDYTWRALPSLFPGPASGLRWSWTPSPQGTSSMSARLAAAADWRSLEWEFTTGAAGRLSLVHRRDPGETRVTGQLRLRRVRLKLLEDASAAPLVL